MNKSLKILEGKNIAIEWFEEGKSKETVFKFMAFWLAFNFMYSRSVYDKEEKLINEFLDDNKDKLKNSYDKIFSNMIDLEIFNELPVYDGRGGRRKKAVETHNNFLYACDKTEKARALILMIYQVRCNLFHGNKSLGNKRDMKLIKASADVMEIILESIL